LLILLALGCFCLRRRSQRRKNIELPFSKPNWTNPSSRLQPSPQSPVRLGYDYPHYLSLQHQEEPVPHELPAQPRVQQPYIEPKYDFASTQEFMSSIPEQINISTPGEIYNDAQPQSSVIAPSQSSHSQQNSHSSHPSQYQSYYYTNQTPVSTVSPHTFIPAEGGPRSPPEPSELYALGPLSRQPRSKASPTINAVYEEYGRGYREPSTADNGQEHRPRYSWER
jgi:hypothetical protein